MAVPKKILVVADVSNLYYCINKKWQARLNYENYLKVCQQHGEIYRAIAYGAAIGSEAQKFIDYLHHRGFETKYKEPRIYRSKISDESGATRSDYRKADWDVGIAIDVVRILPHVDTVVLGSADSDMIPLVEYIQDQGKRAIVVACNIAHDLKTIADNWREIDQLLLDFKVANATA